MAVESVTRLDFDEKVLACPKPALVYFTCSVFCSGIMGERARSKFRFVFSAVARACEEVQCFELDFANVGVGQFFQGVSTYKAMPSIVLYSGGQEIARKAISYAGAGSRNAPEQFAAWVKEQLPS